jgi:hypothetical protein
MLIGVVVLAMAFAEGRQRLAAAADGGRSRL